MLLLFTVPFPLPLPFLGVLPRPFGGIVHRIRPAVADASGCGRAFCFSSSSRKQSEGAHKY